MTQLSLADLIALEGYAGRQSNAASIELQEAAADQRQEKADDMEFWRWLATDALPDEIKARVREAFHHLHR